MLCKTVVFHFYKTMDKEKKCFVIVFKRRSDLFHIEKHACQISCDH